MPPKRSGAPYRRVVISFWTDPDVKSVLSRDEKLFLNYLFTNEHSHPCGVYRLRPIIVMDELEFSKSEMRAMLEGPLAPFATYDWRTEEVFVHAMAEHQIDGKGLHGRDNRIAWVTTQLQMIHARHLVEAFRGRYGDWNLPWDELLPPSPEGPPEGASQGPYQAPSVSKVHDSEKSLNRAEKEGASQGAYQGASQARPRPRPSPRPRAIYPPASAGYSEGGEGLEIVSDPGSEKPKHPELDGLWRGGIRDAVLAVWHQGEPVVQLDRDRVGIGLEYWLFNDLLRFSEEPAFVAWAIQEAPSRLGWTSEPRTLRWLIRGENYLEAERAYRKHQRTHDDPTGLLASLGVEIRSMPGPEAERRREDLHRQIQEARSA